MLYASMVSKCRETSSHSRERNDDCMHMHTVPEIEVHQSLNGYAWIQWLGIAILPYSDIELHSSKLSILNVSFQDFLSSNFTLDGTRCT